MSNQNKTVLVLCACALTCFIGCGPKLHRAAGVLIHVVPIEYNTIESTRLNQTFSSSSTKFEFDIPTKKIK